MEQAGKLILDGAVFALESGKCYFFESDEAEGTLTVGFEAMFQKAAYKDEMVAPSIVINAHETGKTCMRELEGCTYSVQNIEMIAEREDIFYLHEHEPMASYTFTLLEIADESVHIAIQGTAVVDGYAKPYTTAPFSGDFWLEGEK